MNEINKQQQDVLAGQKSCSDSDSGIRQLDLSCLFRPTWAEVEAASFAERSENKVLLAMILDFCIVLGQSSCTHMNSFTGEAAALSPQR